MKIALPLLFLTVLISGCANTSSNHSGSNWLPPGSYVLKGFNSEGKQLGGTVKIDIPFNDPRYAFLGLCSNKGAKIITAMSSTGTETTFKCVEMGVKRPR
jgi:hypothetical protein